MKVSINGVIKEADEARVSVFNRGYLFGEGLFETLRATKGELPFLDKHLERLEWSATFLGIGLPHPQEIREAIRATLKANDLKDARVKLVLTTDNLGGFAPTLPTESMEPHLLVATEKLEGISDRSYEEGESLVTLHSVVNDPPPMVTMKNVSWLTKVMALKEVYEKDAYDGILLNTKGQVTETTKSNIFWVEEETLCTPPVNLGLLGGITRKIVMDLAREDGLIVTEKGVMHSHLKKASEIFITNSIIEILPITYLDGEPIGEGKPGIVTQDLIKAYQSRIEEELE